MELKDVILSTLAEIEEAPTQTPITSIETPAVLDTVFQQETPAASMQDNLFETDAKVEKSDEEIRLLEGIRERLLVLFEGFQSPNNTNIEAKVDLTLNFLEYLLATIENRLETIR